MLSYKELDRLHTLRGFCAFYVVVFHAKIILWSGGKAYLEKFPMSGWDIFEYFKFILDTMSSAGQEMVIVFFVLSGFFIRHAQLKNNRPAIRFYYNRLVRIYPPFIFSMILSGVILIFLNKYHNVIFDISSSRALNKALAYAWKDLENISA